MQMNSTTITLICTEVGVKAQGVQLSYGVPGSERVK